MCVNVQEAWNYCKQGKFKTKNDEIYPSYNDCMPLAETEEHRQLVIEAGGTDQSSKQSLMAWLGNWITILAEEEVTPVYKLSTCIIQNIQKENKCRN